FRTQEGKDFSPPFEVVGVVADSKYNSMRQEQLAIAYVAASQRGGAPGSVTFVIRVRGDVGAGIRSVRSVVGEIAPRAALEISTLDRQISESIRLPRTLATLSGFFGALALLLASIGLYGIMSY